LKGFQTRFSSRILLLHSDFSTSKFRQALLGVHTSWW